MEFCSREFFPVFLRVYFENFANNEHFWKFETKSRIIKSANCLQKSRKKLDKSLENIKPLKMTLWVKENTFLHYSCYSVTPLLKIVCLLQDSNLQLYKGATLYVENVSRPLQLRNNKDNAGNVPWLIWAQYVVVLMAELKNPSRSLWTIREPILTNGGSNECPSFRKILHISLVHPASSVDAKISRFLPKIYILLSRD